MLAHVIAVITYDRNIRSFKVSVGNPPCSNWNLTLAFLSINLQIFIKKLITSLFHDFFHSICPFILLSVNLSISLTGCLTVSLSGILAALLSVHLFWIALVEESKDFILKKNQTPISKTKKVKGKKLIIVSVGTFLSGGVINQKARWNRNPS